MSVYFQLVKDPHTPLATVVYGHKSQARVEAFLRFLKNGKYRRTTLPSFEIRKVEEG